MDTIKKVAQQVMTKAQYHSTPTPENTLPLDQVKVCPICGGMGFMKLDYPPNHPRFGKIEPCNNVVHNDERIERTAKLSGLRPEDLGKTLADIGRSAKNAAMLEATQDMINDPYGWLYIWGGPGNAKSEVLIALANQLGKDTGKSVLYTKLSKITDYMRDSFREKKQRDKYGNSNLGYIERFESLKRTGILAIDEMDKVNNLTEFVQDFRFDFLDDRYRQGQAGETITLFAGNTDPKNFDIAIWDRINDGRFRVVFNGEASARPNMRRKK